MQDRSCCDGELGILLIENEPSDAELFSHAVRLTGLNVRLSWVADVQAGMDYILGKGIYRDRHEYPFPDAIVIGLLLPVISGVEFLKWCRTTELGKNLPLFVLTGALQGEKVIQEALESGADRLYLKSGEMKNLINVIREIYHFVIQRRAKGRAA